MQEFRRKYCEIIISTNFCLTVVNLHCDALQAYQLQQIVRIGCDADGLASWALGGVL